jgi:1-acyl-sn-glycerol-3-phosphate acyltransferase
MTGTLLGYFLTKLGLGPLLLIYLNYVLWDPALSDVREKPRFVPEWLMSVPRTVGMFFDHRVIRTTEIDINDGPYIVCMHPHGVLGLNPQYTLPELNKTVWPGLNIRHCGIRGVFYVPIFREFALAFNSIPVDADLMLQHLLKGVSLSVVVGGAAEALVAGWKGALPLVLDARKGFARLAVQSGARLVPCISFGEHGIFGQVFDERLRKIQSSLMEKVGFSLPLLKPPLRRNRLVMIVGAPLASRRVEEDDPDFQQTVDELHDEYVKALKDLHEKYRKEYGDADEQKLVIISSDDAKDTSKLQSKL